MKKFLTLAAIGGGIVLPLVNVAHAQFATSTVNTILDTTLEDAGSILSTNLPVIFVFLIAIAAVFMFFRWVIRIFSRR